MVVPSVNLSVLNGRMCCCTVGSACVWRGPYWGISVMQMTSRPSPPPPPQLPDEGVPEEGSEGLCAPAPCLSSPAGNWGGWQQPGLLKVRVAQ